MPLGKKKGASHHQKKFTTEIAQIRNDRDPAPSDRGEAVNEKEARQMRRAFEQAIAEITRGLVIEDGLPELTKQHDLTNEQILRPKARVGNVLAKMCDDIDQIRQRSKEKSGRKKRRKRGPRVTVWRPDMD
ncbi:hypothetical protein [Desulfatibacillum alkenivorans]|jgi:hypothetical protein|uniref:hypothetical protein n=1 Tax=Desulfatibacillum alkenivorans TaxID=259354 RepID=UPI000937A54F|nr:hypothetical protein [Desulfatibacillum alkenivorans]